MSDPAPAPRLAAKLHRRVAVILTEDLVLAEEVLARKKLAADIVGRLADRALGVVVIDRARIEANAANRLESVLADVAGLQQFRRAECGLRRNRNGIMRMKPDLHAAL